MPQPSPDLSRRRLLRRTGSAAAAAATAVVLGPAAAPQPPSAAPAPTLAPKGRGYQDSERNRRYYELARF